MKSFEDALAFMKTWDETFDGRDKSRFAAFVPFDRCQDAGLNPAEGMTAESWGDVKPWTEEEVLNQLREDAEFGLEKAEGQRGISSSCMFGVVNMWCHLLENGLEQEDYYGYGRALFERVLNHYGWAASV
jgi:hypothetical protein